MNKRNAPAAYRQRMRIEFDVVVVGTGKDFDALDTLDLRSNLEQAIRPVFLPGLISSASIIALPGPGAAEYLEGLEGQRYPNLDSLPEAVYVLDVDKIK